MPAVLRWALKYTSSYGPKKHKDGPVVIVQCRLRSKQITLSKILQHLCLPLCTIRRIFEIAFSTYYYVEVLHNSEYPVVYFQNQKRSNNWKCQGIANKIWLCLRAPAENFIKDVDGNGEVQALLCFSGSS